MTKPLPPLWWDRVAETNVTSPSSVILVEYIAEDTLDRDDSYVAASPTRCLPYNPKQ